MDSVKIGQFIATCRKHKNMTQQQLADALQITNKAISKWETGQGLPDISLLPRLAECLGVSVDALLRGEPSLHSPDDPLFSIETAINKARVFAAYGEIVRCFYRRRLRACLLVGLLLFAGSFPFFVHSWISESGAFPLLAALSGMVLSAVLLLVCLFFAKIKAGRAIRRYAKEGAAFTVRDAFHRDHWMRTTPFSTQIYPYGQLTCIAQASPFLLLQCDKREFLFLDTASQPPKDIEALASFLKNAAAQASFLQAPRRMYSRQQKTCCLVLGILLSGLLLLQLTYLLLHCVYDYEYLYDILYYIVYLLMAVLLTAFFACLLRRRRKPLILACSICGVFVLLSLFLCCFSPSQTNTLLSTNGVQTLVIKQDKRTGRAAVYRYRKLCFVKLHEFFPYTVDECKMQWLESDVCAVTYTSYDDARIHQYVATYGERGSGAYLDVRSALSGSWVALDTPKWSLRADSGTVLLTAGQDVQQFFLEDSVQFGASALALLQNGVPKWTITLTDDWTDEGGLLLKKGSIKVCRISFDKTAPVSLSSTEPARTPSPPAADAVETGRAVVEEMRRILAEDPALEQYSSRQGYVKVVPETEDIYAVARDAVIANAALFASETEDIHTTINNMQILAGDERDCLMLVRAQQTYTDANTGEVVDESEWEPRIRIMRGAGAYLAVFLEGTTDGSYDLTTGMEQPRKDTSLDPSYRFTTYCQPERYIGEHDD